MTEGAGQKFLVDVIEDPYDENGVDRSLTRANLELSPLECLRIVEELIQLSELAKPWKADSSS
jgi:hypothetical protein